jgi:hypothetical protein
MKVTATSYASQFFVTPTVIVTYDKWLFGYYDITFIWMKWGVSLTWGEIKPR